MKQNAGLVALLIGIITLLFVVRMKYPIALPIHSFSWPETELNATEPVNRRTNALDATPNSTGKNMNTVKISPALSAFPFECENCGHKPTAQQVIDSHGDCEKCGDTVITYTVDAAELILRLTRNPPELE